MTKLKEGVILRPYGPVSHIDNDNITDEIAVVLLDSGRATEADFETMPKGYKFPSDETGDVPQAQAPVKKERSPAQIAAAQAQADKAAKAREEKAAKTAATKAAKTAKKGADPTPGNDPAQNNGTNGAQ